MRRLAAFMSCALVAGAACAGPRDMAGAPQPRTERTLQTVVVGVGMDGWLEGDPERRCLWLAIAPSRRIVSLIWSERFEVRRNPLRVVGVDGQVVARPGDFLILGVGKVTDDRPVDCKVSDQVVVVHSIDAVVAPAPQATAPTS